MYSSSGTKSDQLEQRLLIASVETFPMLYAVKKAENNTYVSCFVEINSWHNKWQRDYYDYIIRKI